MWQILTLQLPGVEVITSCDTEPAVALQTTKLSVPQYLTVPVIQEGQLENAQLEENSWLANANMLLEKIKLRVEMFLPVLRLQLL